MQLLDCLFYEAEKGNKEERTKGGNEICSFMFSTIACFIEGWINLVLLSGATVRGEISKGNTR